MTGSRFARQQEREVPLSLFVFDVLHVDGEDVLDRPGAERAAVLAELVPEAQRTPRVVVSDPAAAQEFLDDAIARGHEGVMVKALDQPYVAGSRGTGWLKVKPVHTLDLVVLAAEWGHGRRRGWLSNLHLGARDPSGEGFVMLGKTFKGLTDEMLGWQTERLLAARDCARRPHRARAARAGRRDRVRRGADQLALPGRRRAALRAGAAPPARQVRARRRTRSRVLRGASAAYAAVRVIVQRGLWATSHG